LGTVEWNGSMHRVQWEAEDRPVRFRLHDRPLSLIPNFAPTSQLQPAIEASMQAWQMAPAFSFRLDGVTSLGTPVQNGENVITLADTALSRDVTTNAWAVARTFFKVAGSRLVIGEVDIVFSPKLKFATNGAPDAGDFQDTLTHELGHALGLAHSPIGAATMWGGGGAAGDILSRSLCDDDIAGARQIYFGRSDLGNGTLVGQVVTDQNAPVLGAHVVAVDTAGVVRVSGVTSRNGAYAISGLSPGSYQVYAEPLDGPMTPLDLYSDEYAAGKRDFRTTFAGGNRSPATVTISAGRETRLDPIRVTAKAHTLNMVTQIWSTDWERWRGTQAVQLRPGQSMLLAVFGPGLDRVSLSGFRVSGSDVNIDLGEVVQGGPPDYDPHVVLPLSVRSGARPGPRNLYVTSGDELLACTGTIEVVAR
jgi:hypothetical protein